MTSLTADTLFDNPRFFGVCVQYWWAQGDEIMPHGAPVLLTREDGRTAIQNALDRQSDTLTVTPLSILR